MKTLKLVCLFVCIAFWQNAYSQSSDAEYTDASKLKSVLKKVNYPYASLTTGKEGDVVIKFTVLQNGKMDNVEILESPDDLFSVSSMEAFSTLKADWIPAKENGVAIDKDYKMVFQYRLQSANNIQKSAEDALASGKAEKALKLYNKAISKNEFDRTLYEGRAKAYYALNMEDEAITDENTALSLDTDLWGLIKIPAKGMASGQ